MADIFISYNRVDQASARRFAQAFEALGFSVWWDATLHSGDAYDQVTERALRDAKAVVVLWSKNSVDSRWVRAEATLAERSKTLVPARIEPCELPIMFELTHTADLSSWSGDTEDPAWRAFVADIHRFIDKHGFIDKHKSNDNSTAQDSPGPSQHSAATPVRQRRHPLLRPGVIAIASLGLAIAIGAVIFATKAVPPDRPAQAAENAGPRDKVSATTVAAIPTTEPVTIAVLPFANMSGDPEQDYFADGVAEEILNVLSRISGLQVRGRTSSFYFKGRQEDLKSIAAQLNVDHILEGSVRKSGDKVRITVQLIHVPSDTHLWSKTYDRVLDDIFAIQEDIAASVASTLEVSLGIGELGSEPGMTRNVKAYELYLAAIRETEYAERSHLQRGIALAEQAVNVDPQFGLAWGVLSNQYRIAARYIMTEQNDLYLQRAETARARATELAPDSRNSLLGNADLMQTQGNWQQAEVVMTQLLERAHDNYTTNLVAGFLAMRVGRPRAAVGYFETATRAEPLHQNPVALIAGMHASLGDYEAARTTYEKARRLPIGNSAVVISGELYLAMAQRDKARVAQLLQQFSEGTVNSLMGKFASEFMAAMALSLNSPDAGIKAVRRFAANPEFKAEALRISTMTFWAAYFGDPQLALDMQYHNGKPVAAPESLWHPLLAEMRRLPGFKQLVTDLGLVAYWRATGNWGEFCKPIGTDDFECH